MYVYSYTHTHVYIYIYIWCQPLLSTDEYVDLFSPALEWMTQSIGMYPFGHSAVGPVKLSLYNYSQFSCI
jgi:hypothetical protein